MSQENVEIVRRAYAAFKRGKPRAGGLAAFDPDIEWKERSSDVFVSDQPRTYRGRQTWQEQISPLSWRRSSGNTSGLKVPERLIDAGEHVGAIAVAQVGGPGADAAAQM